MIRLLRVVQQGVLCLPEPLAYSLGTGMGWVLGSIVRHRRKEVEQRIAFVFPEKNKPEVRSIAKKMYRHLGVTCIEILRLPKFTKAWGEAHIEYRGWEHVEQALKQQRGVLGLMGHIGNWELSGAISLLKGVPVSVIVKTLKPPEFNQFMNDLRHHIGADVYAREKASRKAIRALRKQECVAFVLDQNMVRNRGIFVDFFGKPACTSPGLAQLAIMNQSPIIPLRMERVGKAKHVLHFYPPIYPPKEATEKNVHDLTQQCTHQLEELIKACPEQWIWLHRRWRTQA